MTDINVLMEQADRLLDANQLAEAQKIYLDVGQIAPQYADAWLMLGLIAQEQANPDVAEGHFRHALDLDPQLAEAHLNLANLLLLKARPDEARDSARKAIESDESYVEAWLFMGQMELAGQHYESAVSSFKRAVSLGAVSPDHYFALGKASLQLGHFADAIDSLSSAQAKAPERADVGRTLATALVAGGRAAEALPILHALVNSQSGAAAQTQADVYFTLGAAYYELKAFDHASEWYGKASTANQNSARAKFCLAQTELHLGHYYRVIEHCQAALQLDPGLFEARFLLADALKMTGSFAEATELYLDLMQTQPERHEVIGGLMELYEKTGETNKARELWSSVSTMPLCSIPRIALAAAKIHAQEKNHDDAIAILSSLLQCSDEQKNRFPTDVLIGIHHQLASSLDRKARYGEAFAEFVAANDLYPSTFSVQEHVQTVGRIIDNWNKAQLDLAPAPSRMSHKPIFIIGMPRSGTTLTEQILSRHPLVAAGGEIQAIPQIAAQLSGNDKDRPFASPLCSSITRPQLDQAVATYLDVLKEIDPDAPYITDKLTYNYPHVGLIALMFPQAKIIHCTRDPLDTCLSIYFQNFSGPMGFAARLDAVGTVYGQYARLMQHWKKTIANPIFELSYETLVDQQEDTTRALLEFCGLPWDARCLDFHRSERVALTSSYNQVRQPMYRNSMGRWKNYEGYLASLVSALGNP